MFERSSRCYRRFLLLIDFDPEELSNLIGVEGKGFDMVMVRKYGGSLLVEPLGDIAEDGEISDQAMSQTVFKNRSSDGQLNTHIGSPLEEFIENYT